MANMIFFNSFKNFYKRNKDKGILGKILISSRNFFYRHKYLVPFLFIERDFSVAGEIMSKIFDPTSAVEVLREVRAGEFLKQKFSFGYAGDFEIIMLYSLVRLAKPEAVIETGVASGRSSWAILEALRRNDKGKLYSVDLPQFFRGKRPDTFMTDMGHVEFSGFVPEGEMPGWLIPAELKTRWELILGKSQEKLPVLLDGVGSIDIFYHDSDHSYENMMFEFKAAWPKITKGGFLCSDDVKWNNAFSDFAKQNNVNDYHIASGFGIINKK